MERERTGRSGSSEGTVMEENVKGTRGKVEKMNAQERRENGSRSLFSFGFAPCSSEMEWRKGERVSERRHRFPGCVIGKCCLYPSVQKCPCFTRTEERTSKRKSIQRQKRGKGREIARGLHQKIGRFFCFDFFVIFDKIFDYNQIMVPINAINN